MTAAHLAFAVTIQRVDQVVSSAVIMSDAICLALTLEYLDELTAFGRWDFHLIAQASQESSICQIGRREIGNEERNHVKRDLQTGAAVYREVVDLLFQRCDPSVEEVGCVEALSPEVIDDEEAAVGLHLHGRVIRFVYFIEHQFELISGELSRDVYDWSLDYDPALV